MSLLVLFRPSSAGGGGGANVSAPFVTIDLQSFTPTVSVSDHKNISAPFASITLAGFAPTIQTPRNVDAPFATIDLAAFTPTVTTSSNINVSVPFGAMSLSAFTPTVSVSDFVQVIVVQAGHAGGVPKKVAVRPKVLRKAPQKKFKVTWYKEFVPEPVEVRIPYTSIRLTAYAPKVNVAPTPALIRAKKAHKLALIALYGESGG